MAWERIVGPSDINFMSEESRQTVRLAVSSDGEASLTTVQFPLAPQAITLEHHDDNVRLFITHVEGSLGITLPMSLSLFIALMDGAITHATRG